MKKTVIKLALIASILSTLQSCNNNGVGETSPVPYDVQLTEYVNDSLPNLHSYTYGIYNDKIIMFGGRTRGLHASSYNFALSNENKSIYVIDTKTWNPNPANWKVSHQLVSSIISTDSPTNTVTKFFNSSQFRANNAEFFTKNNTLYVIGGLLGATPTNTTTLPYTLPLFTAIDMPSLINAVESGTAITSGAIRQDSLPLMGITGGELGLMGDTVYLAFGWNYGPSNSFNGAYTHQVSSFTYTDAGIGTALQSTTLTAWHDASPNPNPNSLGNFRRRDGSMSSFIDPSTKNKGFMYFAGVFKNGNTNFDTPVWITNSGANEQNFTMRSNVYTCKVISAFSTSRKESYATMLGGITNSYFTGTLNLLPQLMTEANSPTLTPDVDSFKTVPFSNYITTIKVDTNKTFKQYYMMSTFPALGNTVQIPSAPLPATFTNSPKILPVGGKPFNGAESEMFIHLDPKYLLHNEVIDYDKLMADSVNGATIGYLFGGILSDTTNTNMSSSTNTQILNTIASKRLFSLRLMPYSIPKSKK